MHDEVSVWAGLVGAHHHQLMLLEALQETMGIGDEMVSDPSKPPRVARRHDKGETGEAGNGQGSIKVNRDDGPVGEDGRAY